MVLMVVRSERDSYSKISTRQGLMIARSVYPLPDYISTDRLDTLLLCVTLTGLVAICIKLFQYFDTVKVS